MKRISSRQLYFFLACIAPVGKLLFLPTQLANSARNDLLFPMLASYLVQAGAIFCVLLLAKRKMNLYELLENTFGGIAAKILISIFALFLFYVRSFLFSNSASSCRMCSTIRYLRSLFLRPIISLRRTLFPNPSQPMAGCGIFLRPYPFSGFWEFSFSQWDLPISAHCFP